MPKISHMVHWKVPHAPPPTRSHASHPKQRNLSVVVFPSGLSHECGLDLVIHVMSHKKYVDIFLLHHVENRVVTRYSPHLLLIPRGNRQRVKWWCVPWYPVRVKWDELLFDPFPAMNYDLLRLFPKTVVDMNRENG
jgi:hypothetical protein